MPGCAKVPPSRVSSVQWMDVARPFLGLALGLAMAGCGVLVDRDAPPSGKTHAPGVRDAVVKDEQLSRYGNPESYTVGGKQYHTLKSSAGFDQWGVASWYGKDFHGRRTSSGETYDMYKMTAAHKELPLPTYVRIKNLENGREAVVKVNDRGPFCDNRIIDVSYAVALKLGMQEKGTAFVKVTAVTANVQVPRPTVASAPVRASEPFGIFLQIGAFERRDNAERLNRRVGKYLAKSVHIKEASNNGKSLYRVQIGPIANVDVADQIVDTLTRIGVTEHQFVSIR